MYRSARVMRRAAHTSARPLRAVMKERRPAGMRGGRGHQNRGEGDCLHERHREAGCCNSPETLEARGSRVRDEGHRTWMAHLFASKTRSRSLKAGGLETKR
jgi:hypothetical protein